MVGRLREQLQGSITVKTLSTVPVSVTSMQGANPCPPKTAYLPAWNTGLTKCHLAETVAMTVGWVALTKGE